ncbi:MULTISPECIES: 6-phosphofructokinase [Chromobacterium]|uniref:Pyrophosphate--fructose 6-phosphate 1-phosphotransferase n=1 Tax=Chromobacterium aquaticum TaxID=467180 RepID=A0ABV8ZTP7_9NEIS|nr:MULTISPECIES: 6-phosphofructokinase [Chromobacterium]MCD5363513.1 6-phosphofructokinase [Chromobacterium aquaticum]
MSKPRAVYLQSGGPTAVLNASAQGAIETARQRGLSMYGAFDGLAGLLDGRLCDIDAVSDEAIAQLAFMPGGSFGVSRRMIGSFAEAGDDWRRLREVLARHDIHYLLVNGGNGSLGCAERLAEFERHMGYPLKVVGIPKTIDNDLVGTDNSPGYGSSAKFLASAMREVGLDMTSMGWGRVFIMETMGRHTGWLAAACAAAARNEREAPHLLLLPEVAFDAERFLAAVDDRLARFGQCAIAVAEGITDADGRFVAEAKKSEVYGHEQLGGAGHWIAQLLLRERGISAHVAQVDYLQRAGGHLGSSMDVRQAYIMGERAVEWLLAGKSGVMAGIKRIQDHPYCWDVVEVPLSEVGDQEKRLPPEFIGADGFSVTPAFLDYVRPLMEGERIPPFKDGLPDYRPIAWPKV